MLRYLRRLALAHDDREIIETRRRGLRWRLDVTHPLDRDIYAKGRFEGRTTRLVRRLVREDMRVLDVGANFGYFTTVLADRVGPTGKVWAFEPTGHFGERIAWHLEANNLTERVRVLPFGLSDREAEVEISIGESSATLHPVAGESGTEKIRLRPLDKVAEEFGIDGADFIKVDIDGHEPFFLEGGAEFLKRHQPMMVIEFNQANLKAAGRDVHGQRAQLEQLGYRLFSEKTHRPYRSDEEFAAECASPEGSANVWAIPGDDTRVKLI